MAAPKRSNPFSSTTTALSTPTPTAAIPCPVVCPISSPSKNYYFDTERGTGAHIYYNRAYNNTHGTLYDSASGDNRYDPFYCPNHAGNSNPGLDCNTSGSAFTYPDDYAWTVQAVTQITSLSNAPWVKTAYTYDVLNEPTSITVADQSPQSGQSLTSVTTTMQYDDPGRLTQLSDPDRGTHTCTYDPDGQVLTDLELVPFLTDVGFPHQMSPGEVAIAWTPGHPAVTGTIVRARRPDQISSLINAAEFRLDEREMEEIDRYLRQHP